MRTNDYYFNGIEVGDLLSIYSGKCEVTCRDNDGVYVSELPGGRENYFTWERLVNEQPEVLKVIPDRKLQENTKITGDTSDGYHTFNELYHHRTVLFSVICSEHRQLCWKSRKHHDGTMYDGMFIVGINTPLGQATYHCENEYWDIFVVPELDTAPEWDGHTPEQALERIGSLSRHFPQSPDELPESRIVFESPTAGKAALSPSCDHVGCPSCYFYDPIGKQWCTKPGDLPLCGLRTQYVKLKD